MGYFNSAIVFSSEPGWTQLDRLPPSIGMRGYRHKSAPLWLLEFWSGPSQPSYPFTEGYEANDFSGFESDPTILRLDQLSRCLDIYGGNWLRFALEVSRLTNEDIYFFAADDECYDLGANVESSIVKRLAMNVDLHRIESDQGLFRIELGFEPDDDESEEELKEVARQLNEFGFVSNVSVDERSEGADFYGNVVAEWPSKAGDPEQLLGLGTWDPFDDLQDTLVLEYERSGQAVQKRLSAEERRRLKKMGKGQVEQRSREVEARLREANPAPIGSDEWAENYKAQTLHEKSLRQKLPDRIGAPKASRNYVLHEVDLTPGFAGVPTWYFECSKCRDLLHSTPRKVVACSCGATRVSVVDGTPIIEDGSGARLVRLMARGNKLKFPWWKFWKRF